MCVRAREVIKERFSKQDQFERFLEHFQSITGGHHDD